MPHIDTSNLLTIDASSSLQLEGGPLSLSSPASSFSSAGSDSKSGLVRDQIAFFGWLALSSPSSFLLLEESARSDLYT